MKDDFKFNPKLLDLLVNGVSTLEIPELNIQNLDQARDFLKAYGFDVDKAQDEKKLWNYHRRAVTYIRTELLTDKDEFPELLSDANQLKKISHLLIYASTKDTKENSLQNWACGILKVMHMLVHLDNDLFNSFSGEIQKQILSPIEDHIFSDPVSGICLGSPSDDSSISLKKFETKSFKSSDSSVTKLLAKPDAIVFTILDKVGVRFVTKHLFDVFRVMRYLVNNNLLSFPHVIPEQSNNNLYPINLFLEIMDSLNGDLEYNIKEIDKILKEKQQQEFSRAKYKEKPNDFSASNYKFIKFISRRLIKLKLPIGDTGEVKNLNFFYPFEIQVVDYETFLSNLAGPSSHEEYKKRQRQRAYQRIFNRAKIKDKVL